MAGRGTAQGSFVIVPQAEFTRAKQSAEFRIDYSQYPLSTLGECVLRLTRSPVSSWPHPSAPLQFFECVVRYHDFFALVPESIPNVLSAFLDERCVRRCRSRLIVAAACISRWRRPAVVASTSSTASSPTPRCASSSTRPASSSPASSRPCKTCSSSRPSSCRPTRQRRTHSPGPRTRRANSTASSTCLRPSARSSTSSIRSPTSRSDC